MANPENKQIPYESTQKDIRDAIESVATAIGGITHPDAEDIVYDNSVSGLSATDVQNAIDELSSEKADSSSLATVATSGDYDDLINKPTIPTVNDATLTIQKNGTTIDTFTANSATNKTVNVTVPTATSDLNNDSDFVSDASYVHTDNNFTSALLTKLNGIESGAEVNVQSDWSQSDNTADDYIKNKPSSEVKTATDTFTTVNGGLLEECNIELAPVQDLHGYENPWVGGAGKNSFVSATAKTEEQNGLKIWTDGDGIYHINGTPTETTSISFSLKQGFTIPSSSTHHFYMGNDFSNANVTLSLMNGSTQVDNWSCIPANRDADSYSAMANKYIDGVRVIVQSGVSLSNVSIAPMFLLDTETDTSYAPWDNICPISGHTEVDLYNVGKNLISGLVNETGDLSTGNFTPNPNYIANIGYAEVEENETYIISLNNVGLAVRVFYYDSNKTYISTNTTGGNAFTVPLGIKFLKFHSSATSDLTAKVQLEKGNQITPFKPFAHYYQVQIGSTVYGGTVDLVSGVMTATFAIDTFTSFSGIAESNGFRTNQTLSNTPKEAYGYLKCNMFKRASSYTEAVSGLKNSIGYNASNIILFNMYINGQYVTDFTTANANIPSEGCQIIYELATPFTIQLTPQQIEALVGQNNLSCPLDGQSIQTNGVEYREVFAFDDVEKVVSLRVPISMLGTDESGRTTASQSYASGDYFYKDGYMCKALTSISAGATLTLNTNYSQGTLADVLKAIENA